ncbi:hypothetical protein J3Q64DRAFT_1712108 [Phycomyces blakesleeanus]|uniref:Uncharacterized protein n=1 Tax=Phycomyces blakesleeanus TaxID=4837 RepID=A0ABR3BI74_PHYBL
MKVPSYFVVVFFVHFPYSSLSILFYFIFTRWAIFLCLTMLPVCGNLDKLLDSLSSFRFNLQTLLSDISSKPTSSFFTYSAVVFLK